MKQSMFMILENEELAPDVHQLILEGDTSAIKCAGQFVDLQNDPHIIAFGKLESDETVTDYREFYIPLEYRDKTRTPKYIVIVGAASRYGDYFTGCSSSKLWIDKVELVY